MEEKLKNEEKERKEAEERHKKVQEQIKKRAEEELKKQQKEMDEKIKQGIDKGIEDYKNKNKINLNNIDIEDEQLKINIDELNKQSELYRNQLQDMKKKCYEELNQKYSQILQQKIKEIHNTIIKDVQTQNQQILDNYVKQFEDIEKKREEDYTNSMSKIMMSNANQKEGEISISFVKTTHHGIKCQKCGMDPIIGYRYKCAICKDFNLCEACEQKNYDLQEHMHDFIKMRNEEKRDNTKKIIIEKEPKKIEKKEEKKPHKEPVKQPPIQPVKQIGYKFELLDKNPELYNKTAIWEDKKQDVIFEFGIKNISNVDFPQNGKTKLITDKKNIPGIVINELKAGQDTKIIVKVPIKFLTFGVNLIKAYVTIDGKNIGNAIHLYIKYKSNQVEQFRKEFNLDEKLYDEQKLLGVLQKNQFNASKAFESLFE